eukprot:gene6240-6957_t
MKNNFIAQKIKDVGVQTKITKFGNASTQIPKINTASQAVMTTAVATSSTATSTISVAVEVAACQTDHKITKNIGITTVNFETSNEEEDDDEFFPCVEELPIEASEQHIEVNNKECMNSKIQPMKSLAERE